MKLFLLCLFFFAYIFSTSVSFADNSLLTTPELDRQNIYILIDSQSGKYFYSKIKMVPGEMQETLETRYFSKLEDLYKDLGKSVKTKSSFITKRNLPTTVDTENRNRKVWNTENQWSTEWEQRYGQWVTENITRDFFYDNNLATDCADVAITTRWIFARIHKLPVGQTLAGTNNLVTNESFKTAWNNLPTHEDWKQDTLFKTALDYVLKNTYTHSLWKDSYPVHISEETFLPGSHWLTVGATSGHTKLFISKQTTNITIVASTIPRAVRRLSQQSYNDRRPNPASTGFLKMKWPIKTTSGWRLTSKENMPHYSENQYGDEMESNILNNYAYGFLKSIGLNPSVSNYFRNLVLDLYYAFSDRVNIVTNGYNFCSQNDCTPDTTNYDIHSTPSRDRQILDRVHAVQYLLTNYGETNPELWDEWNYYSTDWSLYVEGEYRTLDFLSTIWTNSLFSSDPRDTPLRRWGLEAQDVLK